MKYLVSVDPGTSVIRANRSVCLEAVAGCGYESEHLPVSIVETEAGNRHEIYERSSKAHGVIDPD